MGGCDSWGASNRRFLLFGGASAACAHTRGSRSGGDFCFLYRERERRVSEACLLQEGERIGMPLKKYSKLGMPQRGQLM